LAILEGVERLWYRFEREQIETWHYEGTNASKDKRYVAELAKKKGLGAILSNDGEIERQENEQTTV
jgi:hypothetical protein